MKACPNCRSVHADEYNGQCNDCGGPMGGVQGNTQGNLAFQYANQLARGQREAQMEQQFRAARNSGQAARPGDAHDRAPIHDSVLDVARRFVIVPPEAQ